MRRPRRPRQSPEALKQAALERKRAVLDAWAPRTALGKQVKAGTVTDVNAVLRDAVQIMEPEIVDTLVPDLSSELLLIGQSKGKFGGGAARVFKQTQKKTREGNKPSFSTCAVVGNRDGLVGLGAGKAKETVPAREKAFRRAKLELMAIPRGSGDWESESTQPHTIPFKVEGKCGSIRVVLMPAPVGTGLVIEPECRKILELAGIKDVWAKSYGHTATKLNLIKACYHALSNLSKVRIKPDDYERLHIVVGAVKKPEKQEEAKA